MANTRSAAKRKRQTEQRTPLNKSVLTGLKGQQKRLTAAVASGDKAKAQVELNVLGVPNLIRRRSAASFIRTSRTVVRAGLQRLSLPSARASVATGNAEAGAV